MNTENQKIVRILSNKDVEIIEEINAYTHVNKKPGFLSAIRQQKTGQKSLAVFRKDSKLAGEIDC